MIFGTLYGEVCAVKLSNIDNDNNDNNNSSNKRNIRKKTRIMRQMGDNIYSLGNYGDNIHDTILGLSWLRNDSNYFIAGSSHGRICLGDSSKAVDTDDHNNGSKHNILCQYRQDNNNNNDDNNNDDDDDDDDVTNSTHSNNNQPNNINNNTTTTTTITRTTNIYNNQSKSLIKQFPSFHKLTSVHVNSNNASLIVSGYSNDINIYDINTSIILQQYKNIHNNHINISRFCNLSPFIFATSSFDSTIKTWDLRQSNLHNNNNPIYKLQCDNGIVMINFSYHDTFLLASCLDNEINQYIFMNGTKHLTYDIPKTGLVGNFTRSYYSASGRYVVTGITLILFISYIG